MRRVICIQICLHRSAQLQPTKFKIFESNRSAYENGYYINASLQLHNFSIYNFSLGSARRAARVKVTGY